MALEMVKIAHGDVIAEVVPERGALISSLRAQGREVLYLEWQLSFERLGKGALGTQAHERRFVMQRPERFTAARVVLAALDAAHALADGRQREVEAEHLRDARAEAEALEACAGEQDRVEAALLESAQARVHVAAQELEAQVGPRETQLSLPPRARRTDPRAGRQVLEALVAQRLERVVGIRPRQDGRDAEAR